MKSTLSQQGNLICLLVCLASLAGCASYEPDKHATDNVVSDWTTEEVVVESQWLTVHVLPLEKEDWAMQYLGISPRKVGMLPVMLVVENPSQELVKLDLASTYLETTSDQKWFPIPVSEATSRALAAGARTVDTLALMVGLAYLPAADAQGRKTHSLEADYHAKSFKPTLINAGATGSGVVFFEFPQGVEAVPNLLFLPFSFEGATSQVSVELPPSLFGEG